MELEKAADRFYLTFDEAEADRIKDPILLEYFRVYEIEVEFSEDQLKDL